jgi:ribosomal 50S subunit-associated protein YjgA (DUF615 family)
MDNLYKIDLTEAFTDTLSATKRLQYEIATARAQGAHILKVMHGSAGDAQWGKLARATRALAKRYKREEKLRFFVLGEACNESDAASRYLVDKFPAAKEQNDAWGKEDDSYIILCL